MIRTDKQKLAALQLQVSALRKALDDVHGTLEELVSNPEPAPRHRRNVRNDRKVDMAANFNKYNKKSPAVTGPFNHGR